jgi:hypothetical protein
MRVGRRHMGFDFQLLPYAEHELLVRLRDVLERERVRVLHAVER